MRVETLITKKDMIHNTSALNAVPSIRCFDDDNVVKRSEILGRPEPRTMRKSQRRLLDNADIQATQCGKI